MDAIVQQLSNKFSEIVKRELTEEQLILVNETNKKCCENCATHDFLDANVLMCEAFKEVTRRDLILYDDTIPETLHQFNNDCILWNTAWNLSKENKFEQIID